jgi:hypothetical protein
MNNKYDLNINAPSSYTSKNKVLELPKANVVNEIPDNANKVRKKIIRGVIKHDTPSNQQGK